MSDEDALLRSALLTIVTAAQRRTKMNTYICPLVGARYRPPAQALLLSMGTGFPLALRREPTNHFDSNAVQVWGDPCAIAPELHENLALALSGFGFGLEDVLAKGEAQLGYIAKEHAVGLTHTINKALLDKGESPTGPYPCTLGFDTKGWPTITVVV